MAIVFNCSSVTAGTNAFIILVVTSFKSNPSLDSRLAIQVWTLESIYSKTAGFKILDFRSMPFNSFCKFVINSLTICRFKINPLVFTA